jgi:hypothetical protein
MTINYSNCLFHAPTFGGDGGIGSNTGYALDSNFTLGTGGDCVGLRFQPPPGGVHLHAAYFFLHAANASSHNLICHLANYGAAATRAGTSIRSVETAGGTTANKWIKFDFSAYEDTLTANDVYWLVVGDAAGSGSGYQLRTRSSSFYTNVSSVSNSLGKMFAFHTNDAGFTTVGTSVSYPIPFVLIFSDGSVVGHPYTQSASPTSNTLERGLKFKFDEKITCSMMIGFFSSSHSTIQIYSSDTIPGGTVWSGFNGGVAYTLPANVKTIQSGIFFPSPVTFEKNTTYRMTVKSSSSNTNPSSEEIEDYATLESSALNTLFGGSNGSWCFTIDNGAGGWTDYNNATDGYRLSRMSLIMQSQVPITGGGGCYSFGG